MIYGWVVKNTIIFLKWIFPSAFKIYKIKHFLVHFGSFSSQDHRMTLISIFLLIQLAQGRLQADLNDLIKQIPHEEMFKIRENYCRSVKFGEKSYFCQKAKDDEPDGIPPGFLLLILSIIKECFQKLSRSSVSDFSWFVRIWNFELQPSPGRRNGTARKGSIRP